MKHFTSLCRLLAAILLASVVVRPGYASNPGEVRTASGPVLGLQVSGMTRFLGIPYAAPPVGRLRWMPPAPPAPWTKPRPANAFGPACAQITTLGPFAGPANANEDCLYLNVFSPSARSAGEKLPVLLWIHGGGYFDGRSDDYDPSRLVRQGHLIVVTINYRLGLFGFLAHPALDGEGHLFGNYGVLDQQAALGWVRDNIASFGGDENNVTVAGQSAGAGIAAIDMLSPLAKGLFHRAILESGPNSPLVPLAIAEAKAGKFAAAAGCDKGAPADVASCLRKLSAQQILALSGTESAVSSYVTGPMIDGTIAPDQFFAAFKAGRINAVPVVIGMTQDEGNFAIGIAEYFSGPSRHPFTAADYQSYAAKTYGGNAGPGDVPPAYPKGTVETILARYPLHAFASPQLAQDALFTDARICRARFLTETIMAKVPVYNYEFDDRSAPSYFPAMPDFAPLAHHTADLQYLFAGYHGGPEGLRIPLNAAQQRLSDAIVRMWSNFARTGNPNGEGDASWPRFEGNAPDTLSEALPAFSVLSDADISARRHCDFWRTILVN